MHEILGRHKEGWTHTAHAITNYTEPDRSFLADHSQSWTLTSRPLGYVVYAVAVMQKFKLALSRTSLANGKNILSLVRTQVSS